MTDKCTETENPPLIVWYQFQVTSIKQTDKQTDERDLQGKDGEGCMTILNRGT